MIAGNDHDDRIRKFAHQSGKLREGMENGRIRRTHCVKHIAANQDQVGAKFDHLINRAGERLRDICLPLVDPVGSGPLELPEPEVQV